MEDVKIKATPEEVAAFLRVRPAGSGSGSGSSYGSGSGSGSGYGSSYGSGSGYGSGYGYGSGSGYDDGSGSGSGYGSSYGSGSGSGSGYGSSYGSGSGSGSGYGYGYGSGSGSGYGSGYGSGDGIKAYNGRRVYIIDDLETIIDQVRGHIARGFVIHSDLTLVPCFVARVGNSFAHGETIRDAVSAAETKELEDAPLEDRIARFRASFQDPDKAVPFLDLYNWHNVLTGSCRMGRDAFTRDHSLDTEGNYTPRFFMTITRNAYGSAAIRQLAAAYGITFDD